MAKQAKEVSFELSRGVRINGKSYFPKAKGKTILPLSETLAKELAAASKGKIVTTKANTEIVKPKEDDGLDEAFGPANPAADE